MELCRLCLAFSESMECEIVDGTKIMNNLISLNIQILVNNSLPTKVCCVCSNIIENFIGYHKNVLLNQEKLLKQFNSNRDMKLLYQTLRYSKDIKTEIEMEIDNNYDHSFYYESNPENYIKDKKENEMHTKLDIENQENNDGKFVEPINYIKNKKSAKQKKPVKLTNLYKENDKLITNTTNGHKKINGNSSGNTILEKDNIKSEDLENCAVTISTELKVSTEEINTICNQNYTDANPIHSQNELENAFLDLSEDKMKIKDKKCLTCFMHFSSSPELIKHYKTIHNGVDKENGREDINENDSDLTGKLKVVKNEKAVRPYICKICGRTFSSVYAIVRHSRAHGDCSLSCSHVCGFTTAYRGALRDHERRHDKDYKYKCTTCGAGFHVKTWHDQHQNIHNNVKPFVCQLCGMAFHMYRYLTAHTSSVHEASRGRRYVCPHCERHFDNTRSYKTHLEEHVGKSKFLCAVCGKECSSRELLRQHSNTHSGIKPFSCSICSKTFSKRYNLAVHRQAHRGEKHLCQDCGKYFAQRSTLLRHTRRCHPDKDYKKNSERIIVTK